MPLPIARMPSHPARFLLAILVLAAWSPSPARAGSPTIRDLEPDVRAARAAAAAALESATTRMRELRDSLSGTDGGHPGIVLACKDILHDAEDPDGPPYSEILARLAALRPERKRVGMAHRDILASLSGPFDRFRELNDRYESKRRETNNQRRKHGLPDSDFKRIPSPDRSHFDSLEDSVERSILAFDEGESRIEALVGTDPAALSATCRVSFLLDDGTTFGQRSVPAGRPAGLPGAKDPERTFHRFEGWMPPTGEDCVDPAVFRTPRTGSPVVFHAKFRELPARVEYLDAAEATPYEIRTDYRRSLGRPVPEPPSPTIPWGKKLLGWTVDGEAYAFDRPVASDVIQVVAVWRDESFPVRFRDGATPANDVAPECMLTLGERIPGVSPSVPREHYDFVGWARKPGAASAEVPAGGSLPGQTLRDLMQPGSQELVLHPVYAPTAYTVRFLSRTDASATPVECRPAEKGSVEKTVKRPADPPPVAGRSFAGWFLEGASSPWDFSTKPTGDVRLVARWSTVTNTATFFHRGGKKVYRQVSGSVDSPVSAPDGAGVEGDGWRFRHWAAGKGDDPWDGAGQPLLADVALHPVCEFVKIPVALEPDGERPATTNLVKYGCALERPEDPVSETGLSRFVAWRRADRPAEEYYDFSEPVKEPFALVGMWQPSGTPGPYDGTPAPAFHPPSTIPAPSGAIEAVRWLEGRGFSPKWARIAAGLLLFILILEAAIVIRRS